MKSVVYHLPSCTTCKKVIDKLSLKEKDFEFRDIKESPLKDEELDGLKDLAGNYEYLFSKRAMLYRELELAQKDLEEEDLKKYLLQHYTFLKRPVIVHKGVISAGSAKSQIEKILKALNE